MPGIRLLLLALPLALAGCDDDTTSGGSSNSTLSPSSQPAFAPYCTGLLKVPMDGMLPAGPGAWILIGSNKASLPAGAEILLGESFDKIEGFALLSSGSPSKVKSDFQTGLVKDTHFTSDCAVGKKTVFVLLQRSTFHADEGLSGQACTLEAGTALTSFFFASSGKVAEVKADEIKATCGFDKAFSGDIVHARLLEK